MKEHLTSFWTLKQVKLQLSKLLTIAAISLMCLMTLFLAGCGIKATPEDSTNQNPLDKPYSNGPSTPPFVNPPTTNPNS
jgi:hypothetical protein